MHHAVPTLITLISSSLPRAPSVASKQPASNPTASTPLLMMPSARLLHRLAPDPAALWEEVALLVDRTTGILVGDDSTLDKPYATKMDRVTRH